MSRASETSRVVEMSEASAPASVALSWRARLAGRQDPYAARGDVAAEVRRFLSSNTFRRVVELTGVTPPAAVLEAGIGSGIFSLAAAARGHRVVALDCVGEVLDGARRAAALLGAEVRRRIDFVCGDLEALPLCRGCFDVVYNEGVVEHWLDEPERRRVIRTLRDLARPGGRVCVVVPHGRHPLHERWVARGYPGYASAPPMTLYGRESLRRDLAAAGLDAIAVDGLAAWQSFNRWPYHSALGLPLGALDRVLPGPRAFRLRFGQSLIACGRRPAQELAP